MKPIYNPNKHYKYTEVFTAHLPMYVQHYTDLYLPDEEIKEREESNMTSSRELAEKIVCEYFRSGIHLKTPVERIESLLDEAMEENLKHEIRERLGLLETIKINEAIERAAKVAEDCEAKTSSDDCHFEIAGRIRRLKKGRIQ